jgi:hypothetical protein
MLPSHQIVILSKTCYTFILCRLVGWERERHREVSVKLLKRSKETFLMASETLEKLYTRYVNSYSSTFSFHFRFSCRLNLLSKADNDIIKWTKIHIYWHNNNDMRWIVITLMTLVTRKIAFFSHIFFLFCVDYYQCNATILWFVNIRKSWFIMIQNHIIINLNS